MAQPDIPEDDHQKASSAVLDTLTGLLQEGLIPDGGMISAHVTVVETMKPDGGTNVYLLFSDGRTTMLTGLLTVGSMMVARYQGD